MRTLLIFGGLAVCVLLVVTPSHGDRTEDGGGEMKTMDSESRRLAKRDDSKKVCCPRRGKKPKNCKRCQGTYSPMGRNYDDTKTTPDGEMKTMDSKSRRLTKRDDSKKVCCPPRGKKPENCKLCPGLRSPIARKYDDTKTPPDGEMKTMVSESRRLTKRDNSKKVCCPPRGKKPKNCKPCRSSTPMARSYVGTATTPDGEMKTMDSESRRLTKRDNSKKVCCPRRGKKPENCKPCQGPYSLLGRNYDGTATTKDESYHTRAALLTALRTEDGGCQRGVDGDVAGGTQHGERRSQSDYTLSRPFHLTNRHR